MKYYKVLQDTRTGLVKNELLTYKELQKVYGQERLIAIGVVQPIEISSHRTFWNFGCRFEIKDAD